MIDKILQPLLSLHGWQAYALVGVLVFAEAADPARLRLPR